MKTTILLLLPLLALALTGCVGVLPVPPSPTTPTFGKVITRPDINFIVPGHTTRAEVEAKLGAGHAALRYPALAYTWEKPAFGWVGWILIIGPDCAVAGGASGEGNHWRAYFVSFDAAGRVAATKFVWLSNRKSLDEQLENWAAPHAFDAREIAENFFNPDTGVPRIIESLGKNGRVVGQ